MEIEDQPTDAKNVLPFRELYWHDANCQVIHASSIGRGFTTPYLIWADGKIGGYGAVFTKHYPGRLMEFYTFPDARQNAESMFRALLIESGATEIEAQTNMPLAHSMLEAFGREIVVESILFQDSATTTLVGGPAVFRARREGDAIKNGAEPDGDWVVDLDGVIVANGGYLTHYNPPYGDIYMETAEPYRRQGYGSYLVQELKRISYENGKKPSARCNPDNEASRKTLERAGFAVAGQLLAGAVDRSRLG